LVQVAATAFLLPAAAPAAVKDLAHRLGIRLLEYSVEEGAPAGKFCIHGGSATDVSVPVASRDFAFILRTSGTTGRAKIVPISHGNVVARADAPGRALGLSPADRCLNLMPLCYQHGLHSGLILPLAAGCSVICPPAFDLETFLACAHEFSPTWYTASFTYHQAILEWLEQQPSALDGHRLRFARTGSGPLPDVVRVSLEKILGVPVLEAYSTTESGTIAANSPSGLRKPGMVGRALDCEVAIMDASANMLASGIEGEIVVRGAAVFGGYENAPAVNERAFRNGWYHTGDHGFIDADGFIKLTGRVDEVINRGGEKIAPREVDEALLAHPAVAEAVSFPVPHARLHQDIAAAIVPRSGLHVTGDELRRFLAKRLAAFKIPHVIVCVAELPKGPTGKFVRTDLAAHFGLGLDAAPSQVRPFSKTQEMLLALWREVLKRQDVGVNDDFFQLGGDSLSAMDLLHRIEEELQYQLPITILAEAPTVSRLAVRVESATLGAKNSVIRVHPQGTRRPLFALFGRWGHIIRLLPVLRSLGPDQPCYGLQPPGMDWSNVSCTTLPEMAAHYVSEVKAAQPHGPYSLLGFSFGGLVVFEMALQLQRMGEVVEFLGIVDANPPTCLFEGGSDICKPSWDYAERRDLINQRLAESHVRARINYILDSRLAQNIFGGELTLFYCTGNAVVAEHDRRRLWLQFADRFRLIPLPGSHGAVDQEPQYTALQTLLRACLRGESPAGSDPATVFDRVYRIEERDDRECIISSTGDVYGVEHGTNQGYVDAVNTDGEKIQIKGWALEPNQRQPAQTIAVFVGDRFLGYGASGAPTPETAKQLVASLVPCSGFDFFFSRDVAPGTAGRPRLFVLSKDYRAAELGLSVEYELAALRAELTQSANEGETVRAKLAQSLNEGDAMRAKLAQSLNEGETMRSQLAQLLDDGEKMRIELSDSAAKSDRLQSEYSVLAERLNAVTRSTSWRVTGPLRYIRRIAARVTKV
jgi:oxalate---CoA ligase